MFPLGWTILERGEEVPDILWQGSVTEAGGDSSTTTSNDRLMAIPAHMHVKIYVCTLKDEIHTGIILLPPGGMIVCVCVG